MLPAFNFLFFLNTGYLTGDFRASNYTFEFNDLIFFMLFIFINIAVITLIKNIPAKSLTPTRSVTVKNLLFFLISIALINYAFGSEKIGVASATTNLLSRLAAKMPVEMIFFMICALSKRKSTIFYGVICVLVISYLKVSLFGLFTTVLGLLIFVGINNYSRKSLVVISILFCIFLYFSGSFILYLYELRSSLRGSNMSIDASEVTSLILGRLSSLSSFYMALSNWIHLEKTAVVEPVITIMVVIMKLPFNGIEHDLTHSFNQFLDVEGYAIFLSLPALFVILFSQSILAFLVFLACFLILCALLKVCVPVIEGRNLIVSCLLIPIVISGSFWELCILVEKMLIFALLLNVIKFVRVSQDR